MFIENIKYMSLMMEPAGMPGDWLERHGCLFKPATV